MKVEEKIRKYFVLMGTDNNGIRHRYSLEKNENFKKAFINFMKDLGFNEKEIAKQFTYYDDLKGYMPLKISDLNDVCKHYKNKEYEIDVFYGNKRIILVIRTNQKKERDRRKKMLKNLKNKSRWMKFPKIKKIKEKGKKIIMRTARRI